MGEGGGNIEGKERDEEAPQDRLAEISNSCGNSSGRDGKNPPHTETN